MKAIGGILLLAALGCAGFAAAAAPVPDTPTLLLKRFETMNSACRGGRGDDPKTIEACTERDRLFDELTQAGWCFGREGEVEANKEWQRCDAALPSDPTGSSEHNLRLVEPTAADATLEPYQYFEKAQASFAAGRREDATFWLYVAQLRWRARLMANPQLDPSGEPALFASLMEVVGRPINEHAFGDVAEATAIIDRALAWDAANPVGSVPADVRERTRSGLVALRDDMRGSVDDIRRQRTANGLPNR